MFLVRYGKGDAFKTTFTISAHLSLVFAFPFAIGILFRRIPWWTPFISIPACLATFYNEKNPTNRKADHLFQLLEKPVSEDFEAAFFIPNLKTYRVVGKTLDLFGISMILLFFSGLADDPRKINLLAGLIFMAMFAVIQWFTSPSLSPFSLVRKQMRDEITTNDRKEIGGRTLPF
jgi:hypothetical protein